MAKHQRAPRRNATRRPPAGPAGWQSDPFCAALARTGAPPADVERAFALRNPDRRLPAIAAELRDLEARRRDLVTERAQVVGVLRDQGWTWASLAAAAGVSRPALIQTAGRS